MHNEKAQLLQGRLHNYQGLTLASKFGNRITWGLSNKLINFFKILEDAMDGCVPKYNTKRKKKNMYLTTEATRKNDLKNKLWSTFMEELLEVIQSNTNNPFLGEYLDMFDITPQMILEKLQDLNPEKSPGQRFQK